MKNFIPVFIFILLGCGTLKDNINESDFISDEEDYYANQSNIDERPLYQATRTSFFDLIHTELRVHFDWEKSYLHGMANITLSPHFYPQNVLLLDAKSMEIYSVQLDNKSLEFEYDDQQLKIALDKTYYKSDTITIQVVYTAKPEEYKGLGSAAISQAKGLYFINPRNDDPNTMPQIWTQGETESNSVWFPTIDAPNQKMTQDIYITVDNKYTTLSNGKLIQSLLNNDSTREDHWQQKLPHAPYLTMMGIGAFSVVKDTWTRKNGEKIDVHYYVEPEWANAAKDIFGNTPEMLTFFSDLLGYEYPWDKYHQIVVRNFVSGAMENTGAVVFSDMVYSNQRDLLDGNWESIISHELFHHWFGDLVTCESWSNLPLNESFANYSQFLWDEYKYGPDEAEHKANEELEGYFYSLINSGDHDLIWFDYSDKDQMFDGHSYNKGGRILHMLRDYLGDEAFFEGIKYYLHKHQYKPAEAHELRIAFEEVCGQDLNWFFNQWFFASGHPTLLVEQERMQNAVLVRITQMQNTDAYPLYYLPMDIAVFDGSGRTLYPVVIDKRVSTFTFPVTDSLRCIIPDADHVILAKWQDNKPDHQYAFQFANGAKYMDRKLSLAKLAQSKTTLRDTTILAALNDPHYQIRIDAIKLCNLIKTSYSSVVLAKLEDMVKNDQKSLVREAALKFLIDNFLSDEKTKELIEFALNNDQSYKVVSVALLGHSKHDTDGAIRAAKAFESERSGTMISGLAALYANDSSETHFTYFESVFKSNLLSGFNLYNTINHFGIYISRQSVEVQDRAFPTFSALMQRDLYTSFFTENIIYYILGANEARIEALLIEIEKFEGEKDFLAAQNARKEQKKRAEMNDRFNALIRE